MNSGKSFAALLGTAAALGGCGGSERLVSPRIPEAVSLTIVAGNQQSAVVNTELAKPLVVSVMQNNKPVVGFTVNFKVTSGGGSIYGGAEVTNSNGIAQDYWTLGTRTDQPQTVEVRAVNPNTGAKTLLGAFSATALPGPATTMSATNFSFQTVCDLSQCYQGQQIVAGKTAPATVVVSDQYGNPVPGVNITFTAGPASGSVAGGNTTTGANGLASPGTWTVSTLASQTENVQRGTITLNTLTAVAPGLTLAPVIYYVFVEPGPATQLVIVHGNNLTAPAGSYVSDPPNSFDYASLPRVRLVDQYNNYIFDALVTYTITSGAGCLGSANCPQTYTTNEISGLGYPILWQLGSAPGPNTMTASASGVPSVIFTATGQ